MKAHTVHMLAFAARADLGRREKPARVPLKVQGSKAALAAQHAAGLLDSITEPQLREAAALALAALEYVQTATAALHRAKEDAELLAAAKGEGAAA